MFYIIVVFLYAVVSVFMCFSRVVCNASCFYIRIYYFSMLLYYVISFLYAFCVCLLVLKPHPITADNLYVGIMLLKACEITLLTAFAIPSAPRALVGVRCPNVPRRWLYLFLCLLGFYTIRAPCSLPPATLLCNPIAPRDAQTIRSPKPSVTPGAPAQKYREGTVTPKA